MVSLPFLKSTNITDAVAVAGEQYCCISEMLLELAKPLPGAGKFGLMGREECQQSIETSALKICGTAFTNDDVPARVNSFGPLAFCEFCMIILLSETKAN